MALLKRSYDFRKSILGKINPGNYRSFIKAKRTLLGETFPVRATENSVINYFEKSKDVFMNQIDDKTILAVVPTSKNAQNPNPIPHMFADILRAKTGCLIMQNKNLETCWKTSDVQIKDNTTLTKRNNNIVDFHVNSENIQDIKSRVDALGYRVVVVDDAITTGETSLRFARRLENCGIPVKGVLGLVVNTSRYPPKEMIDKLSKKLHINLASDKAHLVNEEFNKKLYTTTAPLTTTYINRINKEFNKTHDSESLINGIEKKYKYEKEHFPKHINEIERYYDMNFTKTKNMGNDNKNDNSKKLGL